MNRLIKMLAALGLLASLAACATTNSGYSLPAEIAYPPAIDVPYQEVVNDVEQHIGVEVRWGGQIIGAEDVADITRVTVIAHPLADNGKPQRRTYSNFEGGRFIVEMKDFHHQVDSQFITVYGPITAQEIISNGNKQIAIPVVAALELEDWRYTRNQYHTDFRHGLPYNGLGLRFGFYDGYGYYGIGYRYYPHIYPFAYYGHGRRGHRH